MKKTKTIDKNDILDMVYDVKYHRKDEIVPLYELSQQIWADNGINYEKQLVDIIRPMRFIAGFFKSEEYKDILRKQNVTEKTILMLSVSQHRHICCIITLLVSEYGDGFKDYLIEEDDTIMEVFHEATLLK